MRKRLLMKDFKLSCLEKYSSSYQNATGLNRLFMKLERFFFNQEKAIVYKYAFTIALQTG